MTEIIVRAYSPKTDWSGWLKVNQQTDLFDPRIDREEILRQVSEEKLTHAALVAEADQEIVGIMAVEIVGAWAHCWRLGVLPEWKHRGVGTLLLSEAEKYLCSRGCSLLQLVTWPSRVAWYEKRGFVLQDQEALVLLRKEIGHVTGNS